MRDGILYVAAGPDYLDLAERSARSFRALNPGLAIDIFTDGTPEPGLFDRVEPIPAGATAKLASLPESRFERTLYLDCDTLALAPLGDIFALLDRFELAVAHDMRRTSALIREGHAERPPYAFPQMNCGVLLYRRSPAVSHFLADWQRRYLAAGRKRDQITFRDQLWASDLRFYVLPPEFNLRRVTMLDAWEPLDARPTILHSHRLVQHLRGAAERIEGLDQLLPEERLALAQEWKAFPQAEGAPADRRFHLAEAAAGDDATIGADGVAPVA
ncbi:hypothetical protein [Frigidibacter sp. MR17.24]|uniref:hypothetical protein n=1 Tax=Frigidibacter sp. MR17.24 TaxID=3127345 RepID=UPI003012CE36